MSTPRVRLGDLLVEAQIITREQLEEVLARQASDGRRLGTLLVEAGLVSETQVTQVLSQQLAVPWVSLYHIDFSRQLLNLVPRALAARHGLVPIFVRRVRGLGETLYVAMEDPTHEQARLEVAQASGLHVRAMIAPPGDIRAAIRIYYGDKQRSASLSEAQLEEELEGQRGAAAPAPPPASERLPPPEPSAVEQAPAPAADAGQEPVEVGAAFAAAKAARPTSQAPSIEVHREREVDLAALASRRTDMPQPPKGPPVRMFTLTLLDGTQLSLPARPAQVSAAPVVALPSGADAPAAQLTARDLVAALRAAADGADASEVLGEEARWERLFAALLSLLLKKHLIADWEFVEELSKKSP